MINSKTIIQAVQAINSAGDELEVEQLRVKYIGRKGVITEELKRIGTLKPSERAKAGAELNKAKKQVEEVLERAYKRVRHQAIAKAGDDKIDLTKPAKLEYGHSHPVSIVLDELVRLFWQMGYSVADGPEVESEWYNFEALLVNADHPARDTQDTFYLEDGNLPRTHTSGVQIRYMENHQPPIRIIAPGKVYRNEDEDARHSWAFYQIEGLVVDEGVSLADLKGTLLTMLKAILGESTELKLLPNYFPYTEPSLEVHARCVICNGKGCGTCSDTGWLELGGAGMVHPRVLKNAGVDPLKHSGFAFGFGPERIACIKYGIADVREFWRPRLKMLEQF
jgi:phenylalanyl-tRNA synthetase alpha chain